MAAGSLQAFLAEVAGAVGGNERCDDKVTDCQAGHLGAEFFDDADEFVAHAGAFSGFGFGGVGPEVAAADAAGDDTDDCVGGLLDGGVGDGFDAHVSGAVDQCCSHGLIPYVIVASFQ